MPALALALALLGAIMAPAPPAMADHAWYGGHWYRTAGQYPQPPVYDRNVTFRNGFSYAADAAGTWATASYHGAGGVYTIRPYVPSNGFGGDASDCSLRDWAIVICSAERVYDPGAYNEVYARAYPVDFDNFGHIKGCVIRLSLSKLAGVSDYFLKVVMRHEMGHCLGLIHTGTADSVMRAYDFAAYPPANTNLHDTYALHDMYYWHYG